jgi:NAD(P)-dependent dehydrogenase (short-subunit alcohol dehydrogenase family)
MAKMYAEQGARLVLADMDGDGAEQRTAAICRTGGQALSCQVDVADDEQVRAMIDLAISNYGRLDVLHMNAALTPNSLDGSTMTPEHSQTVVDIPLETWDRTMNVNVRGFLLGVRHAIPHMIRQGGGNIIFTSSTGAIRAEHIRGAYGTSKAAVDGLMRHIATAFGKNNIRANSILPGCMLTTENEPRFSDAFKQIQLKHHALPRLGRAEDIAHAAVFLASDESSFITGHSLVVDGGLTIHLPTFGDFGGSAAI